MHYVNMKECANAGRIATLKLQVGVQLSGATIPNGCLGTPPRSSTVTLDHLRLAMSVCLFFCAYRCFIYLLVFC